MDFGYTPAFVGLGMIVGITRLVRAIKSDRVVATLNADILKLGNLLLFTTTQISYHLGQSAFHLGRASYYTIEGMKILEKLDAAKECLSLYLQYK
jgi:hypothetical protein